MEQRHKSSVELYEETLKENFIFPEKIPSKKKEILSIT
jgi:hypothetical protein